MSLFTSHYLRTGLVAAGLALGAAFISPVSAQNAAADNTVIAKGDGFTVTEKDLKEAAENPALGASGVQNAEQRDTLINYLIDLKMIGHAASVAKVDQEPEFIAKLADLKQQLMVEAYLEKEIQKLVTPEAARKLYDETVKEMKPEPEVRARHILVETEDQAKDAIGRIKKGEDFAKVAAELSKDPGSKENGGELGFFTKERMVAPFAEAAFKLEPKQVSEPVKTDFGWHIIEVEEKRDRPVPSFDELKPQIENYLTRQSQQQVIAALREKAKIERLDKPAEDKTKADDSKTK